jgi:hypothetical protein
MSDIVERLRASIPDCNDIKWRLLSDAAIEIERLRAEVAALRALEREQSK